MFPKNVGLLFFNERPDRFFPATQIDVVWFPDGPGGDQFEEKEFRGPLSIILGEAISYIERNYLKETVVKYPHTAGGRAILEFSDWCHRRGAGERHLPSFIRGAGAG